MAQGPDNSNKNTARKGGLSGFINSLGSSIDDVVNEIKTDLKAMTPPDQLSAKKRAEQEAKNSELQSLVGQAAAGFQEELVEGAEDIAPLPPDPDPTRPPEAQKPDGSLPTGNLWQALLNLSSTTRLRTDACYHALTVEDVENYRRAVASEKTAPYTMGIAAIILQAPLEEELEEGGAIVADDFLLLSLLKALEETRVYGAIGAGPRQIWPNLDALDEALTILLNTHPKLIALGPLGIDEPFAPYTLSKQEDQLALQLDIAADFNLPVILTHRQSLQQLATVLRGAEKLPDLIWMDVITTPEELEVVQEFKMFTVFRPEITTPNFPTAHLYKEIPPGKRLLASGSALVAPHGFSGHFNQPRFLTNTTQSAAKMLFTTDGAITALTNANLANLFHK